MKLNCNLIMGKGRKDVILGKGQTKISSFFVKQNQLQNQQTQPVLSDNSSHISVGVHTSHYFKKDPIKSPVQQSFSEVIISDDELLASPIKEIKHFNDNYDLISTTPRQTSCVKRKLCSEEEIPDVIPATPTVKTRKLTLSSKLTKHSKVGIVKLEKSFADKGRKKGFSLSDSLDDAYNNGVMGDGVHHISLCKKIKLTTNENTCTQGDESSNSTTVKVVSEKFSEISTGNKRTIKDENDDCISLNNTSDCKKLDSLSEQIESHDVQDMKCENLPVTEHYVSDVPSVGCDVEANSLEQLIDTKDISLINKFDRMPVNTGSYVTETGTVISNDDTSICELFLENPKIKVSDSNIQKSTIKKCVDLNNDGACSSSLLEIDKSNSTQCTDVVDSNNKAFGCNLQSNQDKTEESAVVSKCTVSSKDIELQDLSSNSDSVNLEASRCSFQKSDQSAVVLCGKVHTTAGRSAFQQVETKSCVQSSDTTTQEDHLAWLPLEEWDFSQSDEKKKETVVMGKEDELSLENFQRCEIIELSGNKKWEKKIKLRSTHSEATTSCLLQGFWADIDLEIGDIVSVKASQCEASYSTASWFVSNSAGLLVLHPDTLISSTAVVGSHFCGRRGVLSEWFRGIDGDSRIMVIGSLVHELLQEVLECSISTMSTIMDVVQKLLNRSDCIQMLYSACMSKEDAVKELNGFVPYIYNFVNTYVEDLGYKMSPPPQNENNKDGNNVEKWNGTICAIRDIEENIWAPQLGIKGKVDVTVEVKINRHRRNLTKVIPLELKTGRSSFSAEHRGQVTLYTMMMSQLGNKVDSGLLLYLRDGMIQEVKAGNNECRDLIMLRNQLAHFITRLPALIDDGAGFKPPQLPEPINHPSACGKCPYLTICSSFLGRDGLSRLSTSNPLSKFATSATSHLSASHIDYLIHWTGLLLLEESQTFGPVCQKDLWCLTPQQREKRGKSLCSMVVVGTVMEKGDYYVHIFQKDCDQFSDLRISGLAVGEYVTVSTDNRLAVATGTISDITQSTLTLLLNRNITKHSPSSCFHIDIYTLQNGKVFNLTNLGCLMDDTDAAAKLRKLIIDKERPTFVEKLRSSIMRPARPILEPLNVGQRRAVVKALTAKDYFLIKGMPGTGKTATIVSLVELLVKLGQSVVVTSHTHSAVDNVLLKLAARHVDLLRLGSSSRIHPQLRAKSEDDLKANCSSPAQLETLYNSKPVVGTTCLGAGHPLFTRRTFDVCIVDESTQVLQVSVLRPLFSAKKFILIGDPEQLPPVIRNKTAREMGMSESLFERLDSPDASVCLDLQYRMNQAITNVANGLVYNGQLKCGNEQVSSATLHLPAPHMVTEELESETWLCPVLSPAMIHSVLVLDTGPIWDKLRDNTSAFLNLIYNPVNENNECQETSTGSNDVLKCRGLSKVIKEISNEERSCTNLFEAALVKHIVRVMMKGGVEGSSIGVIAPFRAQVALLQKMVASDSDKNVEVNTVDQYQGRDKDVIIFSCTRTENVESPSSKSLPTKNKESEILGDKRRLTVAITRAKHKLLIIGDAQTLHTYQPFQNLFDCLSSEQIIVLSDSSSNFDWCRLMMNIKEVS